MTDLDIRLQFRCELSRPFRHDAALIHDWTIKTDGTVYHCQLK